MNSGELRGYFLPGWYRIFAENKDNKFLAAIKNNSTVEGLLNFAELVSPNRTHHIISVNTFITNSKTKSVAEGLRLSLLNSMKKFLDDNEKEFKYPKDMLSNILRTCPRTLKQFFETKRSPVNDLYELDYQKLEEIEKEIMSRNKRTLFGFFSAKNDYDLTKILKVQPRTIICKEYSPQPKLLPDE